MAIIQQASGQYIGAGEFTVATPAPSSASNRLVVLVAGNVVVNPPSGWTLRNAQVHYMGHYLWDAPGGGTGYTFTSTADGQLIWYIAEITAGAFDVATGANDLASGTSFATPSITPTAGDRTLVASFGSLTSTDQANGVSAWTAGFVEQIDVQIALHDYPGHAIGALETSADGIEAFDTAVTFAAAPSARSAIIAAYATTSGGSQTRTGTIAGTVLLAALAAGTLARSGTTTGMLSMAGDADGTVVRSGAVAGLVSASGDATGAVAVSGAAACALMIDGQATGRIQVRGDLAGTLGISGTADGATDRIGSVAHMLALAGSTIGHTAASGERRGTVDGSIDLTGDTAGMAHKTGTVSGHVTMAPGALGQIDTAGSVTAPIVLNSSMSSTQPGQLLARGAPPAAIFYGKVPAIAVYHGTTLIWTST